MKIFINCKSQIYHLSEKVSPNCSAVRQADPNVHIKDKMVKRQFA